MLHSPTARATSTVTPRSVATCVVTLVLGAVLLHLSLTSEPGRGGFYPASLALAVTWAGGAFLVGGVPLDRSTYDDRPAWVPGLALGAVLVAFFTVGGLVVGLIPAVNRAIHSVLEYSTRGSFTVVLVIAIVTGACEELFFRGALFSLFEGRHPVIATTAIYTLVTCATGNVMLVFAAALLGALTARQRQVTGTVLTPILTHGLWSLGMILILPHVLEVTS
ncbi:type II CAAX prenyl endopeptidase Rce1 family protein [Branchiibius cervicis]|uniref:Type II CAAX prenyl endopeptidase Rce1 family protein n=1 Tax=Branchiibius cervicis TaxID=908252 RepID=A0ABW2AQR3_9MICO